jgi:apolipoprotein N-acyltransferase
MEIRKSGLAVASGLLLTAAFPGLGLDWTAWFALVPLLIAIRTGSFKENFRLGLIAGLVHYLTLVYWLAYTMRTYGYLPWIVCIPVLFLLAFVLGSFVAAFCMALPATAPKPAVALIAIPATWVALEYVRSFIFSGFPWELLGYSQFTRLQLIQISDIFGVYGVSAVVMLVNAAVLLLVLDLSGRTWRAGAVSRRLALVAVLCAGGIFALTWLYGVRRIAAVDELVSHSPGKRVTVVQGNIKQSEKWDQAYQSATIAIYNRLSLAAKAQRPDLVVWPESAAPFYFLFEAGPTAKVMNGIEEVGATFLIGSPSFERSAEGVVYYNSAYLIGPRGEVLSRYDKAHLVPYGEYTPFKEWLPFLGKMVEHVGDFRPGPKGKTMFWDGCRLGVQICYEIIFPDLARAQVKNGASLLINITNDAWYGRTSAPYQHFSMTVFRAVENRRALARAANTGISGFVDPVGRVLALTPIFQEAELTHALPLLNDMSVYTRFGDVFAQACLAASLLGVGAGVWRSRKRKHRGRH